jgi:MSHA biogenesis protein MshJ
MKKPSELQRLRALAAAFDRRPKRERWLMLGAAMVLLLALADSLWLGPAWRGYKAAQARLSQIEQGLVQTRQLKAQSEQERAVAQQQRAAEIQALQQKLQALQGQPGALEGPRMLAVLEELVQRQGQALSLRALSALPAAAPAASAAPPLYRHAVELVLVGNYAALHRYVQDLAQAESRVRVRSMAFVVNQHPEIEMTLQIETLSPQAAWLTL